METKDSDGPKKYIRTFEGDMETVQKGGTPDLAPFTAPEPAPEVPEVESVPKERLVEASPIKETLPPPVPELQIEVPSIKEIPPPVPEPQVAPAPEPIPAPRPIAPENLKTYSSDFTKRMQDTNASTATVIAAEQDSAQGAPIVVPEPPSRSNILFIIGGVVLLILTGVGGYFAYAQYVAVNTPVVVEPILSAPIFFDEKEETLVTGPALVQAITTSVGRPIAVGAVRLLYNSSTTTPDSIFSAMQVPAPDVLLRNINKAGSMAGVVFVNGSQSPFFILSVTSYGNTFSGMLSWETNMPRDLGALFQPYPSPVVAPLPAPATTTATTKKTAATTTPPAPVPVSVPAFHDEVVSNHDVRVYRDSTGRSVLLYGYWNQSTLVIARDPAAFTEILERLATARTP